MIVSSNWLGVPLNELGVPPCGRAYFLLLRQKKVAKEKATPRSAPLRGPERRPRSTGVPKKIDSHGQPEKKPKNEIHSLSVDAFPGPLEGAEQRRGWRIKGEDCLRAKPEFRSPLQSRVAQGTPEGGTDPGSPFLCLLSFGEAKESKTPRKGGTPSKSNKK